MAAKIGPARSPRAQGSDPQSSQPMGLDGSLIAAADKIVRAAPKTMKLRENGRINGER